MDKKLNIGQVKVGTILIVPVMVTILPGTTVSVIETCKAEICKARKNVSV